MKWKILMLNSSYIKLNNQQKIEFTEITVNKFNFIVKCKDSLKLIPITEVESIHGFTEDLKQDG